jgi:hypothetical protein
MMSPVAPVRLSKTKLIGMFEVFLTDTELIFEIVPVLQNRSGKEVSGTVVVALAAIPV